jgi:hypothetical protein
MSESDTQGFDDTKVAAAAMVLGGRLDRVTDDGRRLTFHFSDLSGDFLVEVLSTDVRVPLSSYIGALEQLHSFVSQHRRARRDRAALGGHRA